MGMKASRFAILFLIVVLRAFFVVNLLGLDPEVGRGGEGREASCLTFFNLLQKKKMRR